MYIIWARKKHVQFDQTHRTNWELSYRAVPDDDDDDDDEHTTISVTDNKQWWATFSQF